MSQSPVQQLHQHLALRQWQQAEQMARALQVRNPQNVFLAEVVVDTLRHQQRWADMPAAMQHLQKLAPRSPVLLFDSACWYIAMQQLAGAESCLRLLLEIEPDHQGAPLELARAYAEAGRLDDALATLDRYQPTLQHPIEAIERRAVIYRQMGRLEESLAEAQRALSIQPGRIKSMTVLVNVLGDLGRFAEAEQMLARVMQQDPAASYPAQMRLQLTQGQFHTGWAADARTQRLPPRSNGPGRAWQGEALPAKTLLLYATEGAGDTVQYIRYAQTLAQQGARVLVECQPALKRLLQMAPGVSGVFAQTLDALPREIDFHANLSSLPRLLKQDQANIPRTIPYLFANPEDVDAWRQRFPTQPGRLRVGLCWRGNPRHSEDYRRSMSPEALLPLAALTDIDFYSLQHNALAEDLAKIAAPLRLTDPTAQLRDFADSAAMIEHLDLIVTVDTSVAHLAGALGRPVWLLLNRAGEWRWLWNREDSPWYPTMRLLRQPDASGWSPVMDRVMAELRQQKARI